MTIRWEIKYLDYDCIAARNASVYAVRQKYPPKFFWQYFPNDWEFLNKILCAHIVFTSVRNYRILFNCCNSDKVMAYEARPSSEYLFYIKLKKLEKCDIVATVRPISTKLNAITKNVSLKWLAGKNFNFKILRWRTAAILKIDNLQYLMMMQNGSHKPIGHPPYWAFRMKFVNDRSYCGRYITIFWHFSSEM